MKIPCETQVMLAAMAGTTVGVAAANYVYAKVESYLDSKNTPVQQVIAPKPAEPKPGQKLLEYKPEKKK